MNTAIPTTTNQSTKENAITTITTSNTYSVVAETNTNNRTKRARWAKNLATNPGVFAVTLGDIRVHDGETSRYATFGGAEVIFNFTMANSAQNAGAPWYINAAWLNSDLELIAAVIIQTSDGESHKWNHHQKTDDMPAWLTTKDGYSQRAYEVQSNISYAFNDGDQHGYFQHQAVKRAKAEAERAEHQKRVALAKEQGENYHSAYILNKAPESTTTREESRANIKSALAGIEAAMEAELWEWVKASLGKLRCETTIRDQYGDPYGFVTVSEVAHQIMYRWTQDGFGDVERHIRTAVAREFVRRYLS